MTTKYTDAPRTRVMTPASLNNGVHENHSIGQTMAIAPKKGLFDDISIPQIIAGAAAAATSVALASKIGIAGSVIGAAVSSVITVVSSQVYRHFISASAEAIKGTHAAVDYPAGAYEPVEPDVEEHLGGAATTQEMRQVAGRATTARVAPNSLRAKAAAERSQTQKKVIVFSIAIAIVAVIACAGAILITTAGEGLGERPEPILSSRTTESDANGDTQSQDQQAQADGTQDSSTSADSSSNTQNQSQAPIPLRPTVARRPARPTQAKRLTVHSQARAARRATPRRERAQQTVATPTARAEPRPARHLTTRAKARHRATKHICLS